MRTTTLLAAIAAASGTALAGEPGLSIVLDDFASDPNTLAGGPREVTSTVFANPFNQGAEFFVDTGFDAMGVTGAAIFNSGIGVEQQGRIVWDDNGAGLNFDAAGLGVVGFELDLLMVDQDFEIEMTLETIEGGSAVYARTVSAGDARTEFFSLGDFDLGAGFNAGDVDGIVILFNTRDGATPSLDFIATEFRAVVPAPGAVALLGLGGVLGARRRR